MHDVVNGRLLTADAATSTPADALNRAALLAIYGAVLLAPLLLIVRVAKPGAHDMLVVFADALGFAAMSLVSLQVFSSGRWAATTRPFGLRRVLSLHRRREWPRSSSSWPTSRSCSPTTPRGWRCSTCPPRPAARGQESRPPGPARPRRDVGVASARAIALRAVARSAPGANGDRHRRRIRPHHVGQFLLLGGHRALERARTGPRRSSSAVLVARGRAVRERRASLPRPGGPTRTRRRRHP
jgi:hypothetical protein